MSSQSLLPLADEASVVAPAPDPNIEASHLLNTLNLDEIDMGQYMAPRAQNSDVGRYADQLAKDHRQAELQLVSTAQQSNLTLAEDWPLMWEVLQYRQVITGGIRVRERDKWYLLGEIHEDSRALRDLKLIDPRITDPMLKSYVDSEIPLIQKNLNDAEALSRKLGLSDEDISTFGGD